MTKTGRFDSRRIRKAARPRPSAWRPQVEALEARELLSGNGLTAAPPYLVPAAGGVTTAALLTTGVVLDRTGVAFQQYRMVGIPDGLGAYRDSAGNVQLFMNHELTKPTTSEPVVN